jgi:hypothetical protein
MGADITRATDYFFVIASSSHGLSSWQGAAEGLAVAPDGSGARIQAEQPSRSRGIAIEADRGIR